MPIKLEKDVIAKFSTGRSNEIIAQFNLINEKPDLLDKKIRDYTEFLRDTKQRLENRKKHIAQLESQLKQMNDDTGPFADQLNSDIEMQQYILDQLESESIRKETEKLKHEVISINSNTEKLKSLKCKILIEQESAEDKKSGMYKETLRIIDAYIASNNKKQEEILGKAKTDVVTDEFNPRDPKLIEQYKIETKGIPILKNKLTKPYIDWLKSKGFGN